MADSAPTSLPIARQLRITFTWHLRVRFIQVCIGHSSTKTIYCVSRLQDMVDKQRHRSQGRSVHVVRKKLCGSRASGMAASLVSLGKLCPLPCKSCKLPGINQYTITTHDDQA
mmetsp:Transcript_41792/g.131777  ORF Transcript_41792/g.131777 Transcript_41792/m.131777 type:complete len:113 (+) Transcript_41792:2717-3055(+)